MKLPHRNIDVFCTYFEIEHWLRAKPKFKVKSLFVLLLIYCNDSHVHLVILNSVRVRAVNNDDKNGLWLYTCFNNWLAPLNLKLQKYLLDFWNTRAYLNATSCSSNWKETEFFKSLFWVAETNSASLIL